MFLRTGVSTTTAMEVQHSTRHYLRHAYFGSTLIFFVKHGISHTISRIKYISYVSCKSRINLDRFSRPIAAYCK